MFYSDSQLLDIDLFAGDRDDGDARMQKESMVLTRKVHTCLFSEPHEIPVRTQARVSEAIIDNKWVRFYVCCQCLESWLEEEEASVL